MGRGLEREFDDIDYIGSLSREHKQQLQGRVRSAITREGKRHRADRAPRDLKNYALEVKERLDPRHDVVISPSSLPVAYLDCDQPIVIWVDATFAGMLDFYPEFKDLGRAQIRNGHRVEQEALRRCSLAVYSSEWAAQSALEHYDVDEQKVRVIPFGANLTSDMDRTAVEATIDARGGCKLLFVGVEWIRKGGPLALAITESLRATGIDAHLDVVGCDPGLDPVPEYVTVHGFILKESDGNSDVMGTLFREARFLLLPTRAECFGIAFCEASSFGLPSITTAVGGVGSAINDGINGFALPLEAEPDAYVERISDLLENSGGYHALAMSSYSEYRSRLNWTTACRSLKNALAL